jgi:hypothetical protein
MSASERELRAPSQRRWFDSALVAAREIPEKDAWRAHVQRERDIVHVMQEGETGDVQLEKVTGLRTLDAVQNGPRDVDVQNTDDATVEPFWKTDLVNPRWNTADRVQYCPAPRA